MQSPSVNPGRALRLYPTLVLCSFIKWCLLAAEPPRQNVRRTRTPQNILTMKPLTVLRISLASFATTAIAKEVGHFQSSDCVDPSGLESCYQDADQGFTSCVTNNCAGGSKGCTESCNGNPACVQSKCPDLGIDCINACECVKNTDYIECAATSCWNQVRQLASSQQIDVIHSLTRPWPGIFVRISKDCLRLA